MASFLLCLRNAAGAAFMRKDLLMNKKLFGVLMLCAVTVFGLVSCADIIGQDPDNTVSSEIPNVLDSAAPPDSDAEPNPDWKYEFDPSFIKENAIGYVWEQLDENTKVNLGEVMNAIKEVRLYCPLSKGMSQEESSAFLELLTNCTTFYTWAGTAFNVHTDKASGLVKGITLSYRIDYEDEAAEMADRLEESIDEILSCVSAEDDFGKIRQIHDLLLLNCSYGEQSPVQFSAYGAIVEGSATCQGYADAMLLLLDRAGFEVAFATGEGDDSSVKHKWIYVKCSDGHWYIIDPTWDDPQNQDYPDCIGYDYFLISEEELLKDHAKIYESKFYALPEADCMDMNFHNMMGYCASTSAQAYEILLKQAVSAAKEGKRYLYLRFPDGETMSSVYRELSGGNAGSNMLQSLLKNAQNESGAKIQTSEWKISLNEKTGTLTITMLYEE